MWPIVRVYYSMNPYEYAESIVKLDASRFVFAAFSFSLFHR